MQNEDQITGANSKTFEAPMQPEIPTTQKLPSVFQIHDRVSIRLRPDLVINEAEVMKVHFSEKKVSYDLDVRFHTIIKDEEGTVNRADYTIIRDVDGILLSPQ